jgi:hypothetical protein
MPLTVALIVLAVVLAYFMWRFSMECTRLRTRYANIIDIDIAVTGARRELESARCDRAAQDSASARDRALREQEHQQRLDTRNRAAADTLEKLQRGHETFLAQDTQRRAALNQEYEQALATYPGLKRELSLVHESLEDISFGQYTPHFNFNTPEEYKTALTMLRDRERTLIGDGRAAVCPVNWRVGDSEKEGAHGQAEQ